MELDYIIIALIGFMAFFLKGLTGTGTSTVIIALSTFVIDPKLAVVLASFVNVFGGISMLRVDPVPLKKRYWGVIAIAMFVGSVIGAMALKIIDNDAFKVILGAAFLYVSLNFFFDFGKSRLQDKIVPHVADITDVVVGVFSGFCGGFIGVNAPPLIYHFGRYLNKQYLRRLLVLIFIPAAIAQTVTFYLNGLLTNQIIVYGLVILPAMAIGIYLGNKAHGLVSEKLFKRILAAFLMVVSVRLLVF